MSIVSTIQSPPIWSAAYNPIVWQCQSDQINQYRFKYVFDVYFGGATGPVRYKVPASPVGLGTIDVSALVQVELSINENLPMLSTTPFYSGEALATEVYILAGEEYATTPTGPLVIYNGSGIPGTPSYGLYADGNFRPAPNSTTPVVAWAAGQNPQDYYDWLALGGESALDYEMALGQVNDTGGKFLTRCPYTPQSIRSDEDFTLTWLNYNFEGATASQKVPYAMKATLSNNGVFVGEKIYYNTTTNGGGPWPDCDGPYPGGPTGAEWYLQSFKINPTEISTITRTKDTFWPNSTWAFGYYSPTADVFPNQISAGLTPPTSGISIGSNDDTWLTSQPTSGATGSTEISYKAMTIASGSVLDLELGSSSAWGVDYPNLQIWGCTGSTLTTGANWEKIGDFTTIEQPTNFTYFTYTGTTTKQYFALGLRFQVTGPSQYNEVLIGPTGYPSFTNADCINKWDVTSTLTQEFDQICLQLFPKATAFSDCELGATGLSEEICLTIDDTNCWGFQPIRFAWLNNLGGRDWFTFIKRNTFTQQAERSTFYQLPGYWAKSYSVQDNQPARFGTTVFNVALENSWTASTDWLTEEQSAWLRGMFASPHVIVYLPDRTEPVQVVITDASYSVQTIRRENLFQYFVSFVESQPDVVQGY